MMLFCVQFVSVCLVSAYTLHLSFGLVLLKTKFYIIRIRTLDILKIFRIIDSSITITIHHQLHLLMFSLQVGPFDAMG